MFLLVLLLAAIGLVGIVATLRAVSRDGYRAIRTDALRVPDLRTSHRDPVT